MKKIVCYTDGACSCNPGPGGFGIVFIKNDKISSIIKAIKISRQTIKIAKQNIYFSINLIKYTLF